MLKSPVHYVILDLAKSVPHCSLLVKLESLGIRGSLGLARFSLYAIRAVVNGSFTDWLPGPLLFLLYIDEIHHIISNSTIKLFADETGK